MSWSEELVDSLIQAGWMEEGDNIVAKHGTIWFAKETPWQGTLIDFLERMEARMERIATREKLCQDTANKPAYETLEDTESLVKVLRRLVDSSKTC